MTQVTWQEKKEAEARFLELYGKLNKEQKKAVDTIEGPVMG